MKEWKMHDMENDRKCTHWKMTENHTQKMKEWKMHNIENERMENAQHEKVDVSHTGK